MTERGEGSRTETSMFKFIHLMLRTTFFSLEHLMLQKLLANCATKVLNLLMQLKLEKILAISKLLLLILFFFLLFYLATR